MIAVLFLSIPPTLGKILVLKIKENQLRILIGETKNRRPIISWFFPRAYVGITQGLPSIVMADQNNNVVGPSDYFKLIINKKSSIRKINLGLSINEVIEEVLDVPAAITKASCHRRKWGWALSDIWSLEVTPCENQKCQTNQKEKVTITWQDGHCL